ncbi:23 kDa integral membrane protein-like isoform X2 [Eupeodes corollae]|uniref:23 kDa integral membrane protein-like isoform X2 n=1 Tax=Eupeodes corollae TaxID=290404 RepID=UPI00249370FA|nr:23 kDa integral membrane protein-like isoform X2 [Eupeodes corollae]
MDCGTSMVKYILFLFNTLCSICGILLVIFGSLLLNDISLHKNLKDTVAAQQIPVALIAIGSVILLVSFFGCCGAIRESYCMSMIYSVSLLILLIVQIVAFVFFWINKQQFVNSMGKIVDKAWEERTYEADFMDAIQVGLKCCGKNGPIDYVTTLSLPRTCCENTDCSNPLNTYISGCRSKMTELWSEKSEIIKIAGLVIVGVEVLGFIFGCTLANNIRNYKRQAAY